jgi:hypothetical protein
VKGDTGEEERARGGGEEGERGDVAEVGAELQVVVAGGHGGVGGAGVGFFGGLSLS